MKLFPLKSHENRSRKKDKPEKRRVNWLKPLLQGLTLTAVVGVVVVSAMQLNEKLAVKHWRIQAEAKIKTQIEQQLASIENLDFWHTRASLLQQQLSLGIPDIKYVEISRVLPDSLLVKATARQPVALWENAGKSARVMLIDENAVAYRELKPGEHLDLPLLRINAEALAQATALLNQLQRYNEKKLASLSEVIVAQQQWRLNFAFGEQWQLNQTNLEQDVGQVMKVLAMPQWSQGYWRMDARMPQRWFIRPAKQEVI